MITHECLHVPCDLLSAQALERTPAMRSPASRATSPWRWLTPTSCASSRGCGGSPATPRAKPPWRRRRPSLMPCWTQSGQETSIRFAKARLADCAYILLGSDRALRACHAHQAAQHQTCCEPPVRGGPGALARRCGLALNRCRWHAGVPLQTLCSYAGCHGAGRHRVHGAPATLVFGVPAARRLRGVRRRASKPGECTAGDGLSREGATGDRRRANVRHTANAWRVLAAESRESACWQVDKAERREERVAVAVVTLAQQGGADKYLLLQRPKEGLLAGGVCAPSSQALCCACCRLEHIAGRLAIRRPGCGAVLRCVSSAFC